jgi:hypothetical protein
MTPCLSLSLPALKGRSGRSSPKCPPPTVRTPRCASFRLLTIVRAPPSLAIGSSGYSARISIRWMTCLTFAKRLRTGDAASGRIGSCLRPSTNAAGALYRAARRYVLYRVPEIVTRGRFPDGGESDSTWRTQEARHVGSDTIAPGF